MDGLEFCREGKYGPAAQAFDKASKCMRIMIDEREKACHGKWKNWFRGEYQYDWGKLDWALRPDQRLAQSRELSRLMRLAEVGKTDEKQVVIAALEPGRFKIKGTVGFTQECHVTLPPIDRKGMKHAVVMGDIFATNTDKEGELLVNGHSHPLPKTSGFDRVCSPEIPEIQFPVSELKDGLNTFTFRFANDVYGGDSGYEVFSAVLCVMP